MRLHPGSFFAGAFCGAFCVIALPFVMLFVVGTYQNLLPSIGKSKQTVARSNIESLKMAIENYQSCNDGSIPETLDQLAEHDPNNMDEPHLDNTDILFDPWDNPYIYIVESEEQFEIKSLGPDGLPGGEGKDADISSKDSRQRD